MVELKEPVLRSAPLDSGEPSLIRFSFLGGSSSVPRMPVS